MSDPTNDLDAIFASAIEIALREERDAYIARRCGEDALLRRRLQSIVDAHFRAGDFLESPTALLPTTADNGRVEGPGASVGRYKLLEQIGEGGFAVVFMAEQEQPVRRRVAVKIVKTGMDTRQVIARFEAERQALALMEHPSIAKVLDGGTTESGKPYFVMELVKGTPITAYCDEHQLGIDERLALFSQVCQAVQHAHQKGIIHRDLKPSNVLVSTQDDRPQAKVIDFGIAKATETRLTDKTLYTDFRQLIGTPAYMSPEQVEGSLDIDTRSDVYSLGVLLYELLAGSPPFDPTELRSKAIGEMQRIIREVEPPTPSTRLSSLDVDTQAAKAGKRQLDPKRLAQRMSGELDWIVMKCLEKDRNRRYATANGLGADIDRFLADEPITARAPTRAYRLRKFVRRNKVGVLATTTVVGALLAGLLISGYMFLKEKAARQIAISEAAKATAINDFLMEMLSSAHPDQSKGIDFSVRELLDDFSLGLGERFKNQPETEASIRSAIGNAYRRLSYNREAQEHLSTALELRKQLFGENSVEVAESLLDNAWNLFEVKDLVSGERLARQAVSILRWHDDQVERLIEAMGLLQLTLVDLRQPQEAEKVANEAIELGRRKLPNGSAQLADILHRLVSPALHADDIPRAERLAVESLAMHRRFHGDMHPETAWGLNHLGYVRERQGRYLEAEQLFREALSIFRKHFHEIQGGNPATLASLRAALVAQGKFDELKELNDEMIERLNSPESQVVLAVDEGGYLHMWRARAYQAVGEMEKAEADYTKAFEINPHNFEHWCNLAAFYADIGQWEKAHREATAIIEKLPSNPHFWFNRGDFYMRQGKLRPAISDFSKSLELDPQLINVILQRARCYSLLGEHKKAIADLTHGIALNVTGAEWWFRRAESYLALGELEQAERDYSRAIEISPHVWRYRYWRAELYGRKQQWDDAKAAWASVVESCPATSGDQNELAWKLVTQHNPLLNDPAASVKLAKSAVELAPREGNIWNTLGVAQYRAGDWHAAIESLEKSEELSDGAEGFNKIFLAMAHWQLGDKDEAHQWYDEAVEWIEQKGLKNKELLRFRAEAAELLGVPEPKPAAEPAPAVTSPAEQR